MAFWWVSQNKTFIQEREGGYLWAPKIGANGAVFAHWSNMTLVQPGDIIFSYARQAVGAVGVASTAAYDAPKPADFVGDWNTDGRRVDVVYETLATEVPLRDFVDELVPLLTERHSPITRSGTGVQGYLFAIPTKAGELICRKLDVVAPIEQLVAETLTQTVPDATTREALIQARIGQGRWRQNLLQYWSGRCAVSGLEVAALLRASHIKPWRASNNRERLDVANGLLLGPAYDAAFDVGLISFDSTGRIMISTQLPADQLLAAGIAPQARLSKLGNEQAPYLAQHRSDVFRMR